MDEFRLGIGAAGASLARAALALPSIPGITQRAPNARSMEWVGGRNRGSCGSVGEGRLRYKGGGGETLLLGELLRHYKTLEETDRKRYLY